ncbi:NmrA family transcriptional regulator [Actinocrispum sp. NPDC049592]|uniref:NmrA family transcriptional regulator n=1 Tax=Actinocrispum sp. NPDC049592 TaxID=3154835 RepID=UPI00341618A2
MRKVVLLSSQGVGTGRHPGDLEDAVTGSGIAEWAVLRPSNFDSNALQWAPSINGQRVVAAPFGDVGLPAVDPADIAEVAKVALVGDLNGVVTLTGPELVTPRQQVAAIADALGEPVRFAEQSRAEARDQMLRFMPEPFVETTLELLGRPTADEQRVSPDVERVLGRAPRTFGEWAERSVGAFR